MLTPKALGAVVGVACTLHFFSAVFADEVFLIPDKVFWSIHTFILKHAVAIAVGDDFNRAIFVSSINSSVGGLVAG